MSILDEEMYIQPTMIVNGCHAPTTATLLKATATTGHTTYLFSKAAKITMNGAVETFNKGSTYLLNAAQIAALTAAGASFTSV